MTGRGSQARLTTSIARARTFSASAESAGSAHFLEHRQLLRGRALKVAHQRHRDAHALALLPLPQHRNLPQAEPQPPGQN
jgi:hypothetical protein